MQRWNKLLRKNNYIILLVLAGTREILSFSSCSESCSKSGPRSTYVMRSSGANSARELVGWQDRINNYSRFYSDDNYDNDDNYDEDSLWGSYTCSSEYQKTFDSSAIADELFGSSTLYFTGSQVASRGPRDIIADHFGLSTLYEGTLSIKPVIKTWTTELQTYFGLDRWLTGLYARFNMPLVWTNWNIGACARDETLGSELFAPGYMGVASLDPINSPIATVKSLKEALIGYEGFGDKQEARAFGNINFDGETIVRIADIDMILGWNFLACPEYHLGFNAYFVLPLGNKPCPTTVFSPVAGNCKHYELGAGISGHINLWESNSGNLIALYLEGNCTHMFSNIQQRSFDFCDNGVLSRYLLLKQIGQFKPADSNAYANVLIPAIDWATRYASISIPCKGDVTLKLALRAAWFGCDIGYNLYGQSTERIKILPNYPTVYSSERFALKGLEGTHYFVRAEAPDSLSAVGTLNSSSSQANIYTADFNDVQTTDNPVFIAGPASFGYTSTTPPVQVALAPGQYGVNWHTPNNDIDQRAEDALAQNSAAYYSGQGYPNQTNPGPDIVTPCDLNTYSGAARGFITNKFFTFISYNGTACSEPFFGIGGEIEFEWGDYKGAHNQWGVLVKAGMSF